MMMTMSSLERIKGGMEWFAFHNFRCPREGDWCWSLSKCIANNCWLPGVSRASVDEWLSLRCHYWLKARRAHGQSGLITCMWWWWWCWCWWWWWWWWCIYSTRVCIQVCVCVASDVVERDDDQLVCDKCHSRHYQWYGGITIGEH